ncbi:putative glutamyl-tRNA amidotransferase subunit A [Xylariaceae sp. AK1471]|nr:putative glutamyl-tRNA amidotransferase subunit A [Xylariaceae sp. AK1471]
MAALDLLTATAGDLEAALSDGRLTSENLVSEYLSRIEKYNGYLRAVISTPPKRHVLKIARDLDLERAAGQVRGPLHGIPIILKDNIGTDPELGMETTAGTFALVGSRVAREAPLSRQLQDAGAIIIGKGNLSELSNYRGFQMPCGWSAVGGLTQSPFVTGGKIWDDGYGGHSSPGGSSSGSCVAVVAGLSPISIGTDTNGSLLMPATRNDVFSLKPTLGLISQEGICPISIEFDSAGPIARDPRDIAILMDILVDPSQNAKPAGGYMKSVTGSFDGMRIGVLDPKHWHLPGAMAVPNIEVERQQERDILAAYDALRSAGAEVKDVEIASLDGLEANGLSQIARVMNSGFKKDFEAYLESLEVSKVRTLDEVIQFMRDHAEVEMPKESPNMTRLEGAAKFKLSETERRRAIEAMRDFGQRQAIDLCLEQYGVDVIIGPADSKIGDYYTAAGYPMAVLPLTYLDFNQRPFGVCALASKYQEGTLIHLMSAWAALFNKSRRVPTCLRGYPEDMFSHRDEGDLEIGKTGLERTESGN